MKNTKLTTRQQKLYNTLLDGTALIFTGEKGEELSNKKLYEVTYEGEELKFSWSEVEKVVKHYGKLRTSFNPEWYEIAEFVERLDMAFFMIKEGYLTLAAY